MDKHFILGKLGKERKQIVEYIDDLNKKLSYIDYLVDCVTSNSLKS